MSKMINTFKNTETFVWYFQISCIKTELKGTNISRIKKGDKMNKNILAGLLFVLLTGIIICPVHAGKLYVHGNYSFQGYTQTLNTISASTPFNARLGYGLGYLFGEKDGLKIDYTIFSSGTYDAVSGKVNIDVNSFDLSWMFAFNPEWYLTVGGGMGSMKFSTGTTASTFTGILALGYHLNENIFLEGQSRADASFTGQSTGSGFLYHTISGLNFKAGYMF